MSERHVTIGMIIAAVEAVTGQTRREIISDRRNADVIPSRFAVCWLATKLTLHSLVEIGAAINRDHTAVHHAVARADELRASDPGFRAATDALLLTMQALERAGHLTVAAMADPVAAARRVVARPEREAVRVSTSEIIAMAQLIVEQADDDPSQPYNQETAHAA